jgi:DNA-binding NarL/FixJ family response regulator
MLLSKSSKAYYVTSQLARIIAGKTTLRAGHPRDWCERFYTLDPTACARRDGPRETAMSTQAVSVPSAAPQPYQRLLLVDDHPLVREALREVLKAGQVAETVDEASTAREAVAIAQQTPPEVVLLDVLLPGQNGISATRELRRVAPSCKVLIYTSLAEPNYAADALAAGARGYALKSDMVSELMSALTTIRGDEKYLAPSIKEAMESAGPTLGRAAVATLSPREREVFDLVVDCYSNERIASQLFISVKTVETHRSRINSKLGVHSTAQLLRLAVANGLVAIPRP